MKNVLIISMVLICFSFANQKVIPPYNPAYWDDLRFPANQTKQGANSKPAYDETNTGLTFPANDESAVIYINAQMPHKWQQTAISPHIHFVQTTAAIPVFKMAYRWYAINQPATANFTIISANVLALPYTAGARHQLLEFPDITPPTNPGLSSMIDIKIYRKTGDGAAANILVKEFDIHYEIDQPGSRLEYIK
jgi:hypothetical protein